MRPTNEQREKLLLQRRAQIDAQLALLKARDKEKERKADTRRKILIGAVVMQEMEKNPETDGWVRGLLKSRLVKDRDRDLFGLVALPKASPTEGGSSPA